eukprot:8763147-Pyramimonas_sp.AAC.1
MLRLLLQGPGAVQYFRRLLHPMEPAHIRALTSCLLLPLILMYPPKGIMFIIVLPETLSSASLVS